MNFHYRDFHRSCVCLKLATLIVVNHLAIGGEILGLIARVLYRDADFAVLALSFLPQKVASDL